MNNKPLVSIVVPTYNSSEFVCETLDSALSQTYSKIEIVITDDNSSDNTLDVCKQWIGNHRDSQIEVKLVQSDINTGIAGNANRGFRETKGEWVKFIAGDDILAKDAIESYVNYISDHPTVRHLRACAIHFSGDFNINRLGEPDKVSQYMYQDSVSVERQFKVISKTFFGSGPTYFIHADTLRKIGGFDERFYMQEDYPLFIKMIREGHKMMYLDAVTVYKRVWPYSIQYDKNINDLFPKNKVRMIVEWKYQYKMEALNGFWRQLLRYSLFVQQLIIKRGNTRKSLICQSLYFIYKLTDPFLWYDRWFKAMNMKYIKSHKA